MAPDPNLLIIDGYIPPPFSNTHAIEELHGVHRLTGQNNITTLLFGTSEEGSDYLVGVGAYAAITVVVFGTWAILILGFKCCGRKRVGFLSGKPSDPPSPPDGYVVVVDEETKEHRLILAKEDGEFQDEPSPTSHDDDDDDETKGVETVVIDGDPVVGTTNDQHDNEIQQQEAPTAPVGGEESNNPNDATNNEANDRSPQDDDQKNLYPNDDDQDINDMPEEVLEYKVKMALFEKEIFWTRIVVVVSGIAAIISAIIFVEVGIADLGNSMSSGVDAMVEVKNLLLEVIEIIDEYQMDQAQFSGNLSEFQQLIESNGWCPKLRNDAVAECLALGGENTTLEIEVDVGDSGAPILIPVNITNCTNMTGFPMEQELTEVSLILFLNDSQKQLNEEVQQLEDDFYELVSWMDFLIPRTNSFQWAFYVAAGFALVLCIIIIVLLVGVYLAWKRKLNRVFIWSRALFVVPVFLIALFLVWVFAIVALLGAIVAADFCFGSPDPLILEIYGKFENNFSTLVAGMIRYYLSRCEAPDEVPTPVSRQEVEWATTSLKLTHDALNAIANVDGAAYIAICGIDASPVAALSGAIHFQMHVLVDVVLRVQEFFLCSNIWPIYEIVAYDTICYFGIDGLWNVYVTLTCTLTFSFIFLTFRAAWQEEPEGLMEDDTDDQDEPADDEVVNTAITQEADGGDRDDDDAVGVEKETLQTEEQEQASPPKQ